MPNNATPLISVIVPVYNAEDYLRYCVDSILQQSYTNLEVILVDDGAKDSSPAICDEYAAQDSRVTVIHQENGGIAKAQNTGLDAAHGEYIAFADNDDILDRRNIEYLLHALQNTGADMSKARWRQFGVSQLGEVSKEAETGAQAPGKITVFEHPLAAYQTVFCKACDCSAASSAATPRPATSTRRTGAACTSASCGTACGSPRAITRRISAWQAPCTPAWAKWPTSIACSITGFRSPTR